MQNDENILMFNTPNKVKNITKMTWNSPFQSLQQQNQKQFPEFSQDIEPYEKFKEYEELETNDTATNTNDAIAFHQFNSQYNNQNQSLNSNNNNLDEFNSEENHELLFSNINNDNNYNKNYYNSNIDAYKKNAGNFTDIPVLDDLFSELNSSTDFIQNNVDGEVLARNFGVKSEPIDFDDLERILLAPKNNNSNNTNNRRSTIRQPFSSILNSLKNQNLPTGPFDSESNPMLWDGAINSETGNTAAIQLPQASALHLISESSAVKNGKILIKVIGKRPNENLNNENVFNNNNSHTNNNNNNNRYSYSNNNNFSTISTHTNNNIKIPYIAAPANVKPSQTYRTYGKKRYVIGPEYADFVCRLQNDIPFDSSEDDEDDQFQKEVESKGVNGKRKLNYDNENDENNETDTDNESSDEEEEREAVKISPQELLELFEDSCSGLPGLISAFLTHRKHQIGLKGYRPRASVNKSTASAPALMTNQQFDRIRDQLMKHFQFLIQNLALSNEIEGGEGVTLLSLKLLVQLHLHLDSTCNLRNNNNNNNQETTGIVTNCANTTISCLNLPPPRINPIKSKLNELIPGGIKKVAVIAGFLARPGQKQFLSLSALRGDSTLKPKTTATAPLPLKTKASSSGSEIFNGNGINNNNNNNNTIYNNNTNNNNNIINSFDLLSNAFYNILALFHDYIDAKLLEQTISARNLSKHIEFNNSTEFISTRTAKFLSSEDNLLLSGLHRFGCGNWESIQAQFLPFRTSRQLAIRYKNLSSRREPMNPIKEFNERLMMPLNEIEEDLLYKGVQRFGNQFHLISKHYLPHRPATVLGKLWKAMDEVRRSI